MTCSMCRDKPAQVFSLHKTSTGRAFLPYCGDCARDLTQAFASVSTFKPKPKGA